MAVEVKTRCDIYIRMRGLTRRDRHKRISTKMCESENVVKFWPCTWTRRFRRYRNLQRCADVLTAAVLSDPGRWWTSAFSVIGAYKCTEITRIEVETLSRPEVIVAWTCHWWSRLHRSCAALRQPKSFFVVDIPGIGSDSRLTSVCARFFPHYHERSSLTPNSSMPLLIATFGHFVVVVVEDAGGGSTGSSEIACYYCLPTTQWNMGTTQLIFQANMQWNINATEIGATKSSANSCWANSLGIRVRIECLIFLFVQYFVAMHVDPIGWQLSKFDTLRISVTSTAEHHLKPGVHTNDFAPIHGRRAPYSHSACGKQYIDLWFGVLSSAAAVWI